MDTLSDKVRETVFRYAASGFSHQAFPVVNEDKHLYAVLAIDTPVRKHPAAIVVSARIQNDLVIIDEDITDRPLIDALIENGIPREKIILAYLGDSIPTQG